jgi:hypothetical protein
MLRRYLGRGLILLLTLQTGCAGGPRLLTRGDLSGAEPARSYVVTTHGGETLTFISLVSNGDRVEGTVRTTREQVVGEGEGARTAVSNRYEERWILWDDVKTIEADYGGSGSQGGLWLAAVSVAAGIGAFVLITQDSDPPPDGGGGGKGF